MTGFESDWRYFTERQPERTATFAPVAVRGED
jgi:hypothetical protein